MFSISFTKRAAVENFAAFPVHYTLTAIVLLLALVS
jgi:hypothetical protein